MKPSKPAQPAKPAQSAKPAKPVKPAKPAASAKGPAPAKTSASAKVSAAKAPAATPRPGSGRGKLKAALKAPLRIVRGLLFGKVALKREGKNLVVKLDTKPAPKPVPAKPAVPPAQEAELQLMRDELKKLLDRHPMSRRVMRHLVYVERLLSTHGLKFVSEVPSEVLGIAVDQLEGLVSNWSNAGLAALRSKMSVALVDRSKDPFYGTSGHKPSEFHTESRLQVGDVSHSMFMEIERQYQGLVPPDMLTSLKSSGTAPSFEATRPAELGGVALVPAR